MSANNNGNYQLLEAVYAIHGTGRFLSSGTVPFAFPGLTLPGGEEIAFPLPRAHVENLTINHWRDENDQPVDIGQLSIDESQLLTYVPLDDDEPDEEFADDDYTGNAPPTLEYWYHRAAIVLLEQFPQNA